MRLTTDRKRVGLDLTRGPIFRLLILFAAPMVLTNLVQQLYSTVDLIVIGKFVGNVGTVGVATGGEMADFMTIFAVAIAMGGQIYIAQLAGAKDEKRLKEAVGTLLTLLMGASVVVMAAALLFHRPILEMLNCPGEARGQAAQYMICLLYTSRCV